MMLRTAVGIGGPTVLVALVAPAVAAAQPVDPARDQQAREHFEVGRGAFSRGEFAAAAREFERAYALSHRTQILYNIGASYERLHRWEQAREAFRGYLEANPTAEDHAEVTGRLRAIEEELQRASQAARVVVVERPVVVPRSPVEEPSRPWRAVFWVAGGLTVVIGGATLAVGLLADSRYNTLLTTCGDGAPAPSNRGCRQDDLDDLSLRATMVNLGIGTTAALAALTVGAYVIDALRPREARPAPTGPGGGRGTEPARTSSVPRFGFASAQGGGMITMEGAF